MSSATRSRLQQESVARCLFAVQSRGRAAAAEPRRPSAMPPFERLHDGAGATLRTLPQEAAPREPGDGDCPTTQRAYSYAQRASVRCRFVEPLCVGARRATCGGVHRARSHSHESNRSAGSVGALNCRAWVHRMAVRGGPVHGWLVLTLPPRQQAEGCLIDTHPPRSLPPRRALPDEAYAHVLGAPQGLSITGRGSRPHGSGNRPGSAAGLRDATTTPIS